MPSSSSRFAVLAAAALTGAAMTPACTCSSPSAGLDGGDLMGVFSHDAGSDGGAGMRPRRGHGKPPGDGGVHAAPPVPQPASSVRAPTSAVCVATAGEPDRDIRRTLGRPACRAAQVLEWRDAEGSPRYACVVAPPGVETRAPLPLIVFFHDPDDDPSLVDKKTGLRRSGASYNLSGDPAHTGFIVLAPQGRHLHGGKRGATFDTDYTGADNVDVAAVDHFIGELDAKGLVDHRRVYALGASYGGQMAAVYAMMRADRVAAFAAFAADAPRATWSCGGPPPPALFVYRACDGFISCESVERWLRARDAVQAESTWIRLGAGDEEEPSCATRNKCTRRRSEANHHRWPKGREADFLAFFARHTLGPAEAPPGSPAEPPDP